MSSSCQATHNPWRRSIGAAAVLTLGGLSTTVAAAYGVDAAAGRGLTARSAHSRSTLAPGLSTETPVLIARPVPTALPTASASATSSPSASVSAPPLRHVLSTPPPAPRSRLISADGRLDTAVGVYSDCTGSAPLLRDQAAIDTCVTNRTYFVGHSPGAFSPLLDENVGAIIDWWGGDGSRHRLRIVARRDWARGSGAPAPPVSSAVVAQFQTCLDSTGSQELILDATPA